MDGSEDLASERRIARRWQESSDDQSVTDSKLYIHATTRPVCGPIICTKERATITIKTHAIAIATG